MREIKFRGKVKYNGNHKFNGEWVYGYYRNNDNGNAFITETLDEIDNYIFEETEVEEDTIGQYTGLKDKNGKEIYEGDIIQDEFYERKAEVVFLEGAFWLDYKKDFGVYNTKHNRYQLLANYDYEKVLEVIGNIYDNPELLEE